ncbi:MAG: DegT/DnrJ/EryC1/StrS aminotransferase family protein [Candidatus Schekmanbacteria bacterium]|nr:DegT/DnrJ/EryC1/StrS aminotransferase family protein [Candidatus Schekmanbacteria bacterium]
MSAWIPFHKPDIGEEEIGAVVDCLRSGWLTTGPRTAAFENDFASYLGVRRAVAVSSCTAALHLGLLAAGIGPGDEVVTTPFTFPATVNVILHAGAKPVFADIDRETLNISVAAAEQCISRRTKALVPVHYAGRACPIRELRALAEHHGLYLLQDAAHAIETAVEGRSVAGYGHAAAYSFYATKNISTAEGGMLASDDEEIANRVRLLRLHGISRDAWKRYREPGHGLFTCEAVGFKCNLTDVQSALGLAQLKRIDELWEKRRRRSQEYDRLLGSALPDVACVCRVAEDSRVSRHAHHLYVVLLPLEQLFADRDTIMRAMEEEGIGVSLHFQPLHEMPLYAKLLGTCADDCPAASWAGQRCLSLPLYPGLESSDQSRIVDSLVRVLDRFRR